MEVQWAAELMLDTTAALAVPRNRPNSAKNAPCRIRSNLKNQLNGAKDLFALIEKIKKIINDKSSGKLK